MPHLRFDLLVPIMATVLVLAATVAPASGAPIDGSVPSSRAGRSAALDRARAAALQAGSTAGPVRSDLAPDPKPGPACSGDVRPAPALPPGGRTELVPATYGSSYSCATDTWTYRVHTTAPFDPSRLGAWTVLIDTDGSGLFGPLPANCYGGEYLAGGLPGGGRDVRGRGATPRPATATPSRRGRRHR